MRLPAPLGLDPSPSLSAGPAKVESNQEPMFGTEAHLHLHPNGMFQVIEQCVELEHDGAAVVGKEVTASGSQGS